MIEEKYKIYIDTRSQIPVSKIRYMAKPLDFPLIERCKDDPNLDNLMILIKEHTINSQSETFKNFCLENNINEKIYNKVIRNFHEIIMYYWMCGDINSLPENTILYKADESLIRKCYDNINENNNLCFIKIEDERIYAGYKKYTNIGKNIIASKVGFNNLEETPKDLEDIRYRIYLEDRLLIERFFPRDLPLSSLICEECFLDIKIPSKLRLETNKDLVFTKIVRDKTVFEVNNKEFLIEP